MINIVLDTLIFGLQKMGGVSVVWYEYIQRMLSDKRIMLTLLDIPVEYKSFIFKNLDINKAKHIPEHNWNLQVLRNTSPKLPVSSKPVIFQSTYLRTCRGKNVKNVVMIHDITHQLYFHGIRKWLNTFQKRRAIANADGIICVSKNTLKDIHEYYPRSKKIKSVVVYNGVSKDYCVLTDYEIPEHYAEIKGKKYIIYVGDRVYYKNTDILFEIIRKMPDLHCVLIGGRDYSKSELKKIRGLEDRVHRFTNVPNKELNILYNAAFCTIYPSLYEGFGIPVLEAMRAGCPVIAFNNSSIPEVLRGSGFLHENNDLSGCINSLKSLSDNNVREKIISEELKASEYFDWNRSYEKLIHFYAEVVET